VPEERAFFVRVAVVACCALLAGMRVEKLGDLAERFLGRQKPIIGAR
jgi:hypothetical protein